MCEPVTIGTMALTAGESLMVGVTAASAAMTYVGQQAQADAIGNSQRASYEAQMSQLQLQREQINEQATDQMSARAMAAQAAQAKLRASAGESGVSGISVDRADREIAFNSSQDIATIDKNRRAQIAQTAVNGQAIQAQTQSALNSAPHPSLIGTGLQIAGGFANVAARQPNNSGSGVKVNKE